MIDEFPTREESLDRFDKILANGTTHTSIRDFDNLFDGSLDEGAIDSCGSKFIFHDSNLASFCFTDYVVEKGCLSTSEKARNNSNRNHGGYYIEKCNECVTKELTT
jgi:hypothetical protein